MSDAYAAPIPEGFDETDPHGFQKPGHGQHESHVIVGPFTLRSILFILLVFTVMTVGLAQAEVAIQNYLHIELPWWVNVAVAMSIAVVKALLVMGFFMQLKYDNPINSVLMIFCFGALSLFLFFTGLDLFTRGIIDDTRSGEVVAGGTGSTAANPENKPMVVYARDLFQARLNKRLGDEKGKEMFEFLEHQEHESHGHVEAPEPVVSNASRSRAKTGLTSALSTADPAPAGHGEHAPSEAPKGEHALLPR